jgi:small ligand-binding sensory domain FIST
MASTEVAAGTMARSIVRDVSVRIGCGLSTGPDPRVAATEAGTQARAMLGGAAADLVFLFCSGAHLAAPEATLEGVHEALAPPTLVGCGAGGVLGAGREIESGTAVAVWAAALDGGTAEAFHAEALEMPDGMAVTGLGEADGGTAVVLLPDPYTFPTDAVLGELARRSPGVVILGGLSSARTEEGDAALFIGDRVVGAGAVGVRFDGVEVLPCVSQGAAPVGPELTVTAADGNIIRELAGRPALDRLRDAIDELTADERGMVANGLLLGVVVDGGKPEYGQGDFLVRGLLGADPEDGTVAVGAPIAPGAVVRMHARDARSADRDLRDALGLRVEALGGAAPAGALVFTCNGRGRSMFGVPDHDAAALVEELAGAPAAGFFAAGEIGPVGGDPFLHGFTATVAVFPA